MSSTSSPVRKSYSKTTLACLLFSLAASATAVLGAVCLQGLAAAIVAATSGAAALVAAVVTCGGIIVQARHGRGMRGEPDLFLELNASRHEHSIARADPPRAAPLRRWFMRRFAGHDLLVADVVEVKSWDQIRATLDAEGCCERMPFMPEMLAMCGRRARVFRVVHRLFDYRKSRRMRHMDGAVLLAGAVCDGASHGGCQAACHTIWRAEWLRRVDPSAPSAANESAGSVGPAPDTSLLRFGTQAPRYVCQLTQLHSASLPAAEWNVANFVLPPLSGNVALPAFLVGWLTYLFNEIQELRRGIGFPEFEAGERQSAHGDETRLAVGDMVRVRRSAEIRATLNDDHMHRGMWFEPDMLKHCGQRCQVQAEIQRLIDIVTGEMRTMKTPAYLLRDVHFSGERQFFNAQHEPLFWRSAWLRRE